VDNYCINTLNTQKLEDHEMSQISTRLHGVSSLKKFSSDGAKKPSPLAGFTVLKILGQAKVPLSYLKSYGKN
jgi:hypothetical protein